MQYNLTCKCLGVIRICHYIDLHESEKGGCQTLSRFSRFREQSHDQHLSCDLIPWMQLSLGLHVLVRTCARAVPGDRLITTCAGDMQVRVHNLDRPDISQVFTYAPELSDALRLYSSGLQSPTQHSVYRARPGVA
jgi:hypothetical protein